MFRASDIFARQAGGQAARPVQAKAGAVQKRPAPPAAPHVKAWDPATGAFIEEDIPAEVQALMGGAKRVKTEASPWVKTEASEAAPPRRPPPPAGRPAEPGAAPRPSKRPQGLMVQMSGFGKAELNTRYAQKPGEEIQGLESYWDPTLNYFIYWQSSMRRWAICDTGSADAARSGLAPGWAYKTDAKHFTQPGPWMESWGREWRAARPACSILQGEVQEDAELIKAERPDGTETQLSSEQYQDLVRRVYELKNPAKMLEVDGFLEKYAGREDVLFGLVCDKYQADAQELMAEVQASAVETAEESARGGQLKMVKSEEASMAEVPELSLKEYAVLVQGVYELHNPKKLQDMGRLLKKFRHSMRELYLEVCKKYQVDPAEFWSARQAEHEGAADEEGEPGTAAPV